VFRVNRQILLLCALHDGLEQCVVPGELASVEKSEAGIAVHLAVVPYEALYSLLLGVADVVLIVGGALCLGG